MICSIGIDSGSATTKCVVLRDGVVAGRAVLRTGTDAGAAAAAVLEQARAAAGVRSDTPCEIVATGYGRRLVSNPARVVTEISAAGQAAYQLSGRQACLVLDVGGQDTKVIEVDAGGEVTDFLMNDKCAAGTGRFLEMMSGVLGVDLDGLNALALDARAPVTLNSTCSVFAESEVVSLIARAADRRDIAAGLLRSIAGRIAAMLRHFGGTERVLFCGGGARSVALQHELERAFGQPLTVLDHPQTVVALGAALRAASSGPCSKGRG
jgi:predicted CoA-substrate-specific enzyme activase